MQVSCINISLIQALYSIRIGEGAAGFKAGSPREGIAAPVFVAPDDGREE
jgi:hypothetical protein